MSFRSTLALVVCIFSASSALSDVPRVPFERRTPRPNPWQAPPPANEKPQPVRLRVSLDGAAGNATLILPAKLSAGLAPVETPRVVVALPGTVVGLCVAGSLIAAGAWLMRRNDGKVLVAATLLASISLVSLAVHAQPARLDAPRTAIETGKIRISRGDGLDVQLILPTRTK